MKRLISLLLALMLPLTALAFDDAELRRTENTYTYEEPGTIDTVTRLQNQPYMGELIPNEAYDDGELYAYIDYVRKVDYDATLLRLMVSLTVYEPLQASQIALTVGGKRYTFDMDCVQSEYDGVYMEDYTACITDASLPFVKALAQQKKDTPIPVAFLRLGEAALTGRIIIPGQDMADVYDRYIDLGGKQQELKRLDSVWPCKIEKAQ